jgi:probable HAF family extracellular repeat protein
MLINPTGSGTWANYALSGDGKVMAANYGGFIYRWTLDTPKFPFGGFAYLGPGNFLNSQIGISRDGATIITARTGPDGNVNPALWNQATGWIDLGHPAKGCILDGQWGGGYGVSADGTVAVGLAWYCPGAEGFVWGRTDGMKSLSHPSGPNGRSSRASAISADGRTIVGFSEDPPTGVRRPVLWFGGKTYLFAGLHTPGEASGVSSDGSQIVGQAWDATAASSYAFYYTAGKLVSLGTLSGISSDQSFANAVADNGMTVGWSGDPFGVGIKAFIWSPKLGMQSLAKYLQQRGVLLPFGITLTSALDISTDGSTIVGVWQDARFNQGGWMVRLKR